MVCWSGAAGMSSLVPLFVAHALVGSVNCAQNVQPRIEEPLVITPALEALAVTVTPDGKNFTVAVSGETWFVGGRASISVSGHTYSVSDGSLVLLRKNVKVNSPRNSKPRFHPDHPDCVGT